MKRRPSSRGASPGFTLVEALLATVLMLTIFAALATVSAQWLPNWKHGFTRVQRNEALALGLERLVVDLQSVEYAPVAGERGEVAFDGSELAVTFVRTAAGPNAVGLELVRIAETSNDRGFALVRSTSPFVPANTDRMSGMQPNFKNPVALITTPYRVSFSFAGADKGWRSEWGGSQLLPQAIRVNVRDAASERLLAFSTVVTIQAGAPSFCVRSENVSDCLKGLTSPARTGRQLGDGSAAR